MKQERTVFCLGMKKENVGREEEKGEDRRKTNDKEKEDGSIVEIEYKKK